MHSWTLFDRGRQLLVETWLDEDRTHARLLVDGTEVDTGDGSILDTIKLKGEDLWVKVELLWEGRAREVALIDHDDQEPKDGEEFRVGRFGAHKVPFEPPPGTRAARTYAWRQAHPRLWAARHVAIEIGFIVGGLLGISALLGLLTKWLPDLGWLPDVKAPEWLRNLDPFHWIGELIPDIDWFGWLPDIDLPDMPWLKYVLALAFAVAAGLSELRKRRRREEREAATHAEVRTEPDKRERTVRSDESPEDR